MIYTNKIKEAVFLASTAHKDQKRTVLNYPYISHPLSVLFLVSHFSEDEDTLVSSILHDTVEDTDITLDDIETKFGKSVRDIVDVLTEDNSLLVKKEKKQKQLERFKNANHNVLLIKLADITHNFCDSMLILENFSREEYASFFDGDVKQEIIIEEERIKVIEKAWDENPLLPEVKSRFEDYKKSLENLN